MERDEMRTVDLLRLMYHPPHKGPNFRKPPNETLSSEP